MGLGPEGPRVAHGRAFISNCHDILMRAAPPFHRPVSAKTMSGAKVYLAMAAPPHPPDINVGRDTRNVPSCEKNVQTCTRGLEPRAATLKSRGAGSGLQLHLKCLPDIFFADTGMAFSKCTRFPQRVCRMPSAEAIYAGPHRLVVRTSRRGRDNPG